MLGRPVIEIFKKIRFSLLKLELKLLKNRVKHFGYQLTPPPQLTHSEIFVENFYQANFKRHALISYIVYPFVGGVENGHSNNQECLAMAEILNELGYNVDVISWDNSTFIPDKRYDIVIDNHNNLKRLHPYFQKETLKIFHATNAHWLYQNWVEYGRSFNFFTQNKTSIIPPRLVPPGDSIAFCDVVSMLGNEFTKSTYGQYDKKVYHVPMSVTATSVSLKRNYATAKNKFIWLNSHGALLKGLDVVIEAFLSLSDLELYICGETGKDLEFFKTFMPQLTQATNIQMMGWVDIDGEIFKHLATECAWVVSSSFSEGGGGSILNCMAKGLIPVISKSASITLEINHGFVLEENNAGELVAMLKRIILSSNEQLTSMSLNANRFVTSKHTLNNFKEKYKQFIQKVSGC